MTSHRRRDLSLAFALALGLHTLALGLARGLGLPLAHSAPAAVPPPLQLSLIDERTWHAMLDPVLPGVATELLEAPDTRAFPALEPLASPLPAGTTPLAPPAHSAARAIPLPRASREAAPELLEAPALFEPSEVSTLETPPAALPVDLPVNSALVLSRPSLRYPSGPHRLGIEGTVRAGLEVDKEGRVLRTWLVQSSGNRDLDRSALRNLRDWLFDPANLPARTGGNLFTTTIRFEIK